MERKSIRGQSGFTLIEIIAVLVILGILSAIAVPKYIDLQKQAKQASIDGALGAASSNAALQLAELIVAGNTPVKASALNTALTACCLSVGDYTVSYAITDLTTPPNGLKVIITITATTVSTIDLGDFVVTKTIQL